MLDAVDERRAENHQKQGSLEHQPAEAAETPHRRAQPAARTQAQPLAQHAEADAAQKNAAADDQDNHPILPKAHKIVGIKRKTGVAEGRNRVKHRAEGIKGHGVVPVKQQGRHGFNAQHQAEHLKQKSPQTEITAQQGLTHGLSAGKRHGLAPEQKNNARIGHDAQPPQLHEGQQHNLAQGAQHRAHVHGGKPGDAYGRGG